MTLLTTPHPNASRIAWEQGYRVYKRFHSPRTTVGAAIADHLRRDPDATVSTFGLNESHVAQLIEERQKSGQFVMDELGRLAPELSEADYTKYIRTLRARSMA
jgi:hypothetical protein